MKEKDEKESIIKKLEKLTNIDLWLEELIILEDNYKEYKKIRYNIQNGIEITNKVKSLKIKKKI
jgi:hypothetical protein